MIRFAVVLAGCGVFDGAEIHEATSTLFSISKHGGEYFCFSLNKPQFHVINHETQQPVEGETRNILIESARISRGKVKPLDEYQPEEFDAIIFPGGFGVAKNFFTFAKEGVSCEIDGLIKDVILRTHKAGKFIGGMCVSPGLIVRAFKGTNIHPKVTGGKEVGLADAIGKMGGIHMECDATEACIDEDNKIVTTPAYTSAQNIFEVFQGVESMIVTIIKGLNQK